MRKNEEKIAIYSRKSKFTGKGESIGNQIELCKDYIRNMFGEKYVELCEVFEDEGFSGGSENDGRCTQTEIQSNCCLSLGQNQP